MNSKKPHRLTADNSLSIIKQLADNGCISLCTITVQQPPVILFANDAFYRLCGYNDEKDMYSCMGIDTWRLVYSADQPTLFGTLKNAVTTKKSLSITFRIITKNGSIHYVHMVGEPRREIEKIVIDAGIIELVNKGAATTAPVSISVSEPARPAGDYFLYTTLNLTSGIVDYEDGTSDYICRQLTNGLIISYVAYLSTHFVYTEDRSEFTEFLTREHLLSLYVSNILKDKLEFRFITAQKIFWVRLNVHLTKQLTSDEIKAVLVFSDIDEQRRKMERLAQLASRDSLTKLYNHEATVQHITEKLSVFENGSTLSLFMIDIDDFKQINDTLGHQSGDDILIHIASILRHSFRTSDIIGRIGGDEFLVYSTFNASDEVIHKKAAALCSSLQLSIGTNPTINVSASIGVAVAKKKVSFTSFYKTADAAAYTAKNAGKSRYQIVETSTTNDAPSVSLSPKTAPSFNSIQLQPLLQYMDGGILLIEVAAEIKLLYISPSFKTAFGHSQTEKWEEPDLLKEIYSPDLKKFENALRTGAVKDAPIELTFRTEDFSGKINWRHLRAVRIPYDNTFPVVLAIITDITRLKEQENVIAESNERLRIAFDQTSSMLWEVDLKTKVFAMFDNTTQTYVANTIVPNFPLSIIKEGWIHPDSVVSYKAFCNGLLRGNPTGHGAFLVRSRRTLEYCWAALSYHTLYTSTGIARKAIGITEYLPSIETKHYRFIKENRLFTALRRTAYSCAKINLTQDIVEEYYPLKTIENYPSYSSYCNQKAIHLSGKDKSTYWNIFSRNNLLTAAKNGKISMYKEFKIKKPNAAAAVFSQEMWFTNNPVSKEIYAFNFCCNISKSRQWLPLACNPLLLDNELSLYSQDTAIPYIDTLVSHLPEETPFAVVFIKILGLKETFDAENPSSFTGEGQIVGHVFRFILGNEYILSNYKQNQFFLFKPYVFSKSIIRNQILKTFDEVRKVQIFLKIKRHLHFNFDIAIGNTSEINWHIVLQNTIKNTEKK